MLKENLAIAEPTPTNLDIFGSMLWFIVPFFNLEGL